MTEYDDDGKKIQHRSMSDQKVGDRGFYNFIWQSTLEAGPGGIRLDRLLKNGIKAEVWQSDVAKHVGEKLRACSVRGILVVPLNPTIDRFKADNFMLVHPQFFEIAFQNPFIAAKWRDVKEVRVLKRGPNDT